jgi:DNA-binding response OmpR family regulator
MAEPLRDESYTTGLDTLLIAEDNAADVGLIRLALRHYGLGFDVRVVNDGEEAIRFIEGVEADLTAPCPALAVLDLNLPRIGGDEILRRVRRSAKWHRVPVIVMSSSLATRDREEALMWGASAYFTKPSELEKFLELGAVIKDALRDSTE